MAKWYRKAGGGIVGITRTTSVLFRWTLSYNFHAHIATFTRKIHHVNDNDEETCNESNPSRKLRDNTDERKVLELLQQANIFSVNGQPMLPERLQNMVTKDIATTQIKESLLQANSLGTGKAGDLCEGKAYGTRRRWKS